MQVRGQSIAVQQSAIASTQSGTPFPKLFFELDYYGNLKRGGVSTWRNEMQGVNGILLHFDDDVDVAFYQRQHLLPRPLSPIGASVVGILTHLTVFQALESADDVVGIFIMRRGSESDDVHFPSFQQGEGFVQI